MFSSTQYSTELMATARLSRSSGYSGTSTSTFSSVRENFKAETEFGWFLPSNDYFNFTQEDGDRKYRQASVLFLLADINESLHVLMTKRSNSIRTHKGKYRRSAY